MASTVFQLTLRAIVFTLTIGIATVPTSAEQKQCNAVATCRLGKEKLIVKTTVTASPHNQSQTAAYSKYEVKVRNHIAVKPLRDEMETVKSGSTSTAAHCNFEETTDMDLGALLDAGKGALVTLVAGKTRLTAHRAVLAARSPTLAAMLCHGKEGTRSSQVAIPEVEGPVLRHMLAYLYTLKAPQLSGMAPQLLAAADKFGLTALKADFEAQLVAHLTVETAAATAVLAIRHSSTSLRQAAIAFIRAHLEQVFATKGWVDAIRNQPEDVIEVSRLLNERPTETSTPAAADSQPTAKVQSRSSSSHGQATSPDARAVSRLRGLSTQEKGRRLIQAATGDRVEEVKVLLAAEADVGAKDEDSMTALHWAAAKGHVKVVRRLLGARAEVDARDRWQWTPLHWAALSGHAAAVRLLLASSADPNAGDVSGWLPLHKAAFNGQAEAAAALLAAGADTGATDNKGNTPLDLARQEKHQQLVEMLT